MKKTFLSLVIVFVISMGAQSQINLIGLTINPISGAVELAKWQAFDSLSVRTVPTILDGYFFTTSAFDALNSEYYIMGISGDSTGLYSYNTGTGTERLMTASTYTNISEFDMSTGKMYNLTIDSTDYINVYEYDVTSNLDTFRGTIYESGLIGLFTDAIGFDSNNGIIYYVGSATDSTTSLYAISVRGGFSYTKTTLNTTAPINNIFGINFDNVNEKIYALNDTYDSLFAMTGRSVIEINKVTGDVVNRGNLSEFPYYVGGSSSFDQATSTYLLVGIDTAGNTKMIGFNTLTNTYMAGFVPSFVSEIVCDNSVFARRTYGSTSGITQSSTSPISLYPNPVTDVLTINNTLAGPVKIQIFSALGNQVFEQDYSASNNIRLNLESLSPGLYVLNLRSNDQSISEKILVQ
jgi:hypothetical protein